MSLRARHAPHCIAAKAASDPRGVRCRALLQRNAFPALVHKRREELQRLGRFGADPHRIISLAAVRRRLSAMFMNAPRLAKNVVFPQRQRPIASGGIWPTISRNLRSSSWPAEASYLAWHITASNKHIKIRSSESVSLPWPSVRVPRNGRRPVDRRHAAASTIGRRLDYRRRKGGGRL